MPADTDITVATPAAVRSARLVASLDRKLAEAGTVKTGTGASLAVTSANQYAASTSPNAPGVVVFTGPLYVTVEAVTDGSFNASGNAYIDVGVDTWE